MRHELLRSLLFACAVSALIAAATPAPGPRRARRQPNFGEGRGGARDTETGDRPGRDQPGTGPGTASGRTADLTEPPLPAGVARGHRRRARYRGRRGGVNWARHGGTDRRTLIIGQLNVQSVKSKLPELRAEISNVYGFHVLGLCETWLTANVPNRLLGVPGFTSIVPTDRNIVSWLEVTVVWQYWPTTLSKSRCYLHPSLRAVNRVI